VPHSTPSPRRARRVTGWRALALVPALALVAVGCSNSTDDSSSGSSKGTSLKSGLGSEAKDRKLTFLLAQDPGDPFWTTIAQGAKDAAQLLHIDLNMQTSSGDQSKYNDLIGSAVADKPAALAVVLDDPNKYTENVCAAQKAGIPVMTYNITQAGKAGDCVLGFVGQDFEEVGFLLGQRLLADNPDIGKGDTVLTPVEFPDQVYAVQRHAGVKRALDEVGAKTELLGTGIEDSAALDKITQYLLGHKDTAAIVPLGGTPHRNVVKAMEDSGAKVPVVGFDLAPQIISGIKSGAITAAADQQGYVQGFQTVMQLGMLLDFGLSPASINSGGSGLVDKDNVGVAEKLAGKVR
jgi:ABC-type sugar transport system substrate-binding protein